MKLSKKKLTSAQAIFDTPREVAELTAARSLRNLSA